MENDADVAVLGAGVAGLSAALWCARQGLQTTLVEPVGPGGQVMNTGELVSHAGLPAGVTGPELVDRLVSQVFERDVAMEFGAAEKIRSDSDAFVIEADGGPISSRAVIVATGARLRHLGITGEAELEGMGVSHCAVCDGPGFAGKDVMVVGGGDSALEAVAYLAGRCPTVTLVHRGDALAGLAELRAEAEATGARTLLGAEAVGILGESAVTGVKVRRSDGVEEDIAVAGVFIEIGAEPVSEVVDGLAEVDSSGGILVDSNLMTATPGIFAAGAVRSGHRGQIASAIGEGVDAALAAGAWLGSR